VEQLKLDQGFFDKLTTAMDTGIHASGSQHTNDDIFLHVLLFIYCLSGATKPATFTLSFQISPKNIVRS
jgi:hypothetical protein